VQDLRKLNSFSHKIKNAIQKFELDLNGKTVLTEAATGNYVVTPVIAALSGATVYAYTKSSRFGSVDEVKHQTNVLAESLGVADRIQIYESLDHVDFSDIDVLTNTGFLRPINHNLINKLPKKCVLTLMWEPWEFRPDEIDLGACLEAGIKVYGTHEDDIRLRTKDYIGFTVLKLLLDNGNLPVNSNILVLGSASFTDYITPLLKKNGYECQVHNDYSKAIDPSPFTLIVTAEHEQNQLLIGSSGNAFLKNNQLSNIETILHISGNVDFTGSKYNHLPDNPAPYGYMSFTADFVSEQAVIDLHTAGLKVAEGMLEANTKGFTGMEYKSFMETHYPALAFDDERYW